MSVKIKGKDVDEGQMDFNEFKNALETDEEFRTQYISADKAGKADEFHRLIKPGTEPKDEEEKPVGTQEKIEEKPVTGPKKVKISTEIEEELLGTYLTNRSPEEAILEVIKGKRASDETIELLKKRLKETEGDNVSVKKVLEEERSKKAQQQAQTPKEEPKQDNDILELLEKEDDLLTLDPQAAKKLAKKIKDLESKFGAVSPKINELDTKLKNEEDRKLADEYSHNLLKREFDEIEELLTIEPSLKPAGKTFKQLNDEVTSFIDDVNRFYGGPKGIELYSSTSKEGEDFRAKVAAARITPPSEIEKHQKVVELKTQRDAAWNKQREAIEKTLGRKLSIRELPDPILKYSDVYYKERGRGGFQTPIQETSETHRKVSAPPQKVAKELDPNASSGMPGEEELLRLFQKDSSGYNKSEAQLVYNTYKTNPDLKNVPIPKSLTKRMKELELIN